MLQKTDVEYIITWVAFPVLILLIVLGRWAAKYENIYAMVRPLSPDTSSRTYLQAIFMVGLVAGCAYFIFKLIRIWQQETTTYYRLTKSLTVFDALSLLSLGACFVYGVVVWRNFGKGLKEVGAYHTVCDLSQLTQTVLDQNKGNSSASSAIGLWGTRTKTDEEPIPEVDLQQRRISID